MRGCKTCGAPVSYAGRGRPREYCDSCRQWVKRRNDEQVCDWCGGHVEGSSWAHYCCSECLTAATSREEDVPDTPPVRLQDGPGPYIWEVGDRYLVTTRCEWPINAGGAETVRCGIIADFRDRTVAAEWVERYQRRWGA